MFFFVKEEVRGKGVLWAACGPVSPPKSADAPASFAGAEVVKGRRLGSSWRRRRTAWAKMGTKRSTYFFSFFKPLGTRADSGVGMQYKYRDISTVLLWVVTVLDCLTVVKR